MGGLWGGVCGALAAPLGLSRTPLTASLGLSLVVGPLPPLRLPPQPPAAGTSLRGSCRASPRAPLGPPGAVLQRGSEHPSLAAPHCSQGWEPPPKGRLCPPAQPAACCERAGQSLASQRAAGLTRAVLGADTSRCLCTRFAPRLLGAPALWVYGSATAVEVTNFCYGAVRVFPAPS